MVVDTSALVAILRGEEEAPVFIDLIDGSERAALSSVTFVENFSVLCGRRIGATREQVDQLIRALGLTVDAVDERQQSLAADALFAWGRHPAKLNLGDVFSYALAKSLEVPLLFKGDDFSRTDILRAWHLD
jgi:ribonuclease VapC